MFSAVPSALSLCWRYWDSRSAARQCFVFHAFHTKHTKPTVTQFFNDVKSVSQSSCCQKKTYLILFLCEVTTPETADGFKTKESYSRQWGNVASLSRTGCSGVVWQTKMVREVVSFHRETLQQCWLEMMQISTCYFHIRVECWNIFPWIVKFQECCMF